MRRSGVEFTIEVAGPITINGDNLNVGDEFRVAGRCRVIGIAEELVDITSNGSAPTTMPGQTSITLAITELNEDAT